MAAFSKIMVFNRNPLPFINIISYQHKNEDGHSKLWWICVFNKWSFLNFNSNTIEGGSTDTRLTTWSHT
jgi:hypothetical protein